MRSFEYSDKLAGCKGGGMLEHDFSANGHPIQAYC